MNNPTTAKMIETLDGSMSRAALAGFTIRPNKMEAPDDNNVILAYSHEETEFYSLYARHMILGDDFWLGDFDTLPGALRGLAALKDEIYGEAA